MAASVYALLRRIIRRRSGLLQLESAWLPWQIVERFMFEYAFFSTDCVLIFSGGTWHKRIWSAASGQCLRTLIGGGNEWWNVALAVNSNMLCTCSNRTVIIWRSQIETWRSSSFTTCRPNM